MGKVTVEEVKRIADLIRLEVTDREADEYETFINGLLDFTKDINEVDVDGLEPTYSVVEVTNVFRNDEAEKSLTQEEALKNAPESEDGKVKVPSILE